MSGYLDQRYVASLAEFGTPTVLERSGGALLARAIPGASGLCDLMGPYPLLACRRWDALRDDLAELSGPVSVVAVADPFGTWSMEDLRLAFPDLLRPYKRHWVVDLQDRPLDRVSRHHRYYARKASRQVRVDVVDNPVSYLEVWCQLYQTLSHRHGLRGIKAFSPTAFAIQLAIPGLTMLRVARGDQTLGLQLWYSVDDVAYSHLTAFHEDAYRLRAAYALYEHAIEHFRGSVRWLDLGGSPGANSGEGGLDAFKRGWANAERTTWLGGRILDPGAYATLIDEGVSTSSYFPPYRAGELA